MTRWLPDQPFDDLPHLPPAAELETTRVLKACVEARAELAGLKRSADLIPNPGVLINTLPLLEAQTSSEIENIVTTADALFQQLQGGAGANPATREALRYREALIESYRSLGDRPVSTRTAERICTRIKGVEMTVREAETMLANPATGEVTYTPPAPGPRLRDLLSNWEHFVHSDDPLDPIVRMAAAHYQFEAIHPFTDGNGRTGRVLNSLLLVEWGLLSSPILYLSRYIIAHKAEYYGRLLAVTREDAWEPWVLYVVQAVAETARWTTAKIGAIRELQGVTKAQIRAQMPRLYSHELLDVIFEQPYCRIANLVTAKIAERQAASRYLKQLVTIGVLREQAVGREKLFVNSRLLHLLTRDTNEFEGFRA
jgi:cell filamentation protein, protein adenylyltransferase